MRVAESAVCSARSSDSADERCGPVPKPFVVQKAWTWPADEPLAAQLLPCPRGVRGDSFQQRPERRDGLAEGAALDERLARSGGVVQLHAREAAQLGGRAREDHVEALAEDGVRERREVGGGVGAERRELRRPSAADAPYVGRGHLAEPRLGAGMAVEADARRAAGGKFDAREFGSGLGERARGGEGDADRDARPAQHAGADLARERLDLAADLLGRAFRHRDPEEGLVDGVGLDVRRERLQTTA